MGCRTPSPRGSAARTPRRGTGARARRQPVQRGERRVIELLVEVGDRRAALARRVPAEVLLAVEDVAGVVLHDQQDVVVGREGLAVGGQEACRSPFGGPSRRRRGTRCQRRRGRDRPDHPGAGRSGSMPSGTTRHAIGRHAAADRPARGSTGCAPRAGRSSTRSRRPSVADTGRSPRLGRGCAERRSPARRGAERPPAAPSRGGSRHPRRHPRHLGARRGRGRVALPPSARSPERTRSARRSFRRGGCASQTVSACQARPSSSRSERQGGLAGRRRLDESAEDAQQVGAITVVREAMVRRHQRGRGGRGRRAGGSARSRSGRRRVGNQRSVGR